MYDRVNLAEMLRRSGFEDPLQRDFRTSAIPDWPEYGLDRDEAGREYLPGSLYMEAARGEEG